MMATLLPPLLEGYMGGSPEFSKVKIMPTMITASNHIWNFNRTIHAFLSKVLSEKSIFQQIGRFVCAMSTL